MSVLSLYTNLNFVFIFNAFFSCLEWEILYHVYGLNVGFHVYGLNVGFPYSLFVPYQQASMNATILGATSDTSISLKKCID